MRLGLESYKRTESPKVTKVKMMRLGLDSPTTLLSHSMVRLN